MAEKLLEETRLEKKEAGAKVVISSLHQVNSSSSLGSPRKKPSGSYTYPAGSHFDILLHTYSAPTFSFRKDKEPEASQKLCC